jgi:(p)ppGpp synthase/HD superfamily hydrolase
MRARAPAPRMDSGVRLIASAFDFAARKHAGQQRKGIDRAPYVNHLAEVAHLLAEATGGRDPELVAAGLLHDVVEDQDVTEAEVAAKFGADVAALVAEVTDDKSLPKEERKRRQIESTPTKSDRAKMLKIADKTSNFRSLLSTPPPDWPASRRRDYLEFGRRVVDGARGVSPALEAEFDAAARRLEAELVKP